MTSRTYHVYRDENVWTVKKLGRSAKTFSTRREAIASARASLTKSRPGQILVHGNDGNIVKRENHGLAVRPKLPYKSPNAAKIRRAVALAVLEQVKTENHSSRGN